MRAVGRGTQVCVKEQDDEENYVDPADSVAYGFIRCICIAAGYREPKGIRRSEKHDSTGESRRD